jgi:hypothetical protein
VRIEFQNFCILSAGTFWFWLAIAACGGAGLLLLQEQRDHLKQRLT